MVKNILLDTNILIDELRKPDSTTIWKKLFTQKAKMFISAITITELWTGESMADNQVKNKVLNLLRQTTTIPLTREILKGAGELLRENKDLTLADALLAATCLSKKLPLTTLNARHFKEIPSLKLHNA